MLCGLPRQEVILFIEFEALLPFGSGAFLFSGKLRGMIFRST